MNTKNIGNLAEALVRVDLIKRGYYVSTVEGDNAPYDLVVDRSGALERVQVKSRQPKDGAISVELFTTHYDSSINSNNRSKHVYYTPETIDWIAVVDSDTFNIFYIRMKDVEGKKIFKLRVSPSKNNQIKNVRLAEHYKDI